MACTTPGSRLAIVLSHPTQYYSPWFQWLRASTSLNFRVFYLWDAGRTPKHDPQFGATFVWDVDLLSGYDHEFVPNTSPQPGTYQFNGLRNPSLLRRLAAWRPDAILLFGYAYESNLRTLLWARLRGIPVIFRGDSHLLGRGELPWTRQLALRFLYAQFAAITYVGVANHGYFSASGVPASKLFFAPHSVDATRFSAADPRHRAAASALRERLGIAPAQRVVLFAGKLVPDKQPRALLEAFLAIDRPGAVLVFVGAGSEYDALQRIAQHARPGQVHFLPFANQSEMPARYAMADIFTLPSQGVYETWGLAINEAMHLGCPCLVSDRVGCQRDLVTDGETGWVFPAGDSDALREKLSEGLSADRGAFAPAISDRIARYTYRQTTDGLLAALESCRPAARVTP